MNTQQKLKEIENNTISRIRISAAIYKAYKVGLRYERIEVDENEPQPNSVRSKKAEEMIQNILKELFATYEKP